MACTSCLEVSFCKSESAPHRPPPLPLIDSLPLLPSPTPSPPQPGHDCSIRLWNLESKTCVQEFTAHRKKSEESIHDVAFHPTKCYIGSAGADALAKVFV